MIRKKVTMTGCCSIPPREAPAIPLWINGRPVLTMPRFFHDIRETSTQRLIRRVPMVDIDLASASVTVNRDAPELSAAARRPFLTTLQEALVELTAHFAGLSAVESHTHLDSGKADVDNALDLVAALIEQAGRPALPVSRPILGVAGAGLPMTAALKLVLPVVLAGGAVTLVPDPNAPSCALALAELCGQCGLPDGLFNVVYLDDSVVQQLIVENPDVALRLFGPQAWAQRWQALAMSRSIACELVLA
jgi:acyl-CoA reductase-like NAD-dependent aldehyde dehydrogenase